MDTPAPKTFIYQLQQFQPEFGHKIIAGMAPLTSYIDKRLYWGRDWEFVLYLNFFDSQNYNYTFFACFHLFFPSKSIPLIAHMKSRS